MQSASISSARSQQRALVVALGASNLSRGLSRLVTICRRCTLKPIDLFAGAGHGRSYGANSRTWSRRLPSILGSGLWRSLDRYSGGYALACTTRLAVITDIGNDLLYGFSVEQIVIWIEEIVFRLQQRGFDVVITQLPIESIQAVGSLRFHVLKSIFVPGCQHSLETIKDQSIQLNNEISSLSKSHRVTILRQPGSWYGIDAIHVKRSCLNKLWQCVGDGWQKMSQEQDEMRESDEFCGWQEWSRLGVASAEVRSLGGLMLFTPQPVLQLADTTRIYLY
ncbi:MAG: SGNH/GDSL hydrolase family protein [Planctomycetaceae bacterium]|nr:SGNH/GDSL hydrolase family protein [Planctomycetaceae bacterium]